MVGVLEVVVSLENSVLMYMTHVAIDLFQPKMSCSLSFSGM